VSRRGPSLDRKRLPIAAVHTVPDLAPSEPEHAPGVAREMCDGQPVSLGRDPIAHRALFKSCGKFVTSLSMTRD
jgi:hypothetical protein